MEKMKFYLAPLQEYTGYIYRNAYRDTFDCIDKFFIPYITLDKQNQIKSRQLRDTLYKNNRSKDTTAQILLSPFEDMNILMSNIENYSEININLGCPHPMVARDNKGSGLLRYPSMIEKLFENIFHSYSHKQWSVKIRLGWDNTSLSNDIIDLINRYDFKELIIHPRLGTQQYKGFVDLDEFEKYYQEINTDIIYNGDITSVEEYNKIIARFPNMKGVMIGRGILLDPLLIYKILDIEYQKEDILNKFHWKIYNQYCKEYPQEDIVCNYMSKFWFYFKSQYPESKKSIKQLTKCRQLSHYEEIVHDIL